MKIRNTTQLFACTLLLIFTSVSVCGQSSELNLSYPVNKAAIHDNMPTLTWHDSEHSSYDVWIDGIKLGSDIEKNWFIPFPLSYGPHQWKVIARSGSTEISSETFSFTIQGAPLTDLPDNALLLREDWKVLSSHSAGKDGAALTKKKVDLSTWNSTSLPATVLTVMVRNGEYPNPYTNTNNMLIPDLNDKFNKKFDLLKYSHIEGKNPWLEPYWYRKEFEVPRDYTGKKVWLTIGEINYRAEVWLNGERLADTVQLLGMERSFKLDITDKVKLKGNNILAIAIYPPDHPGLPADPPLTPLAPPGLNMADGMISHDYTKWDVLGWDWIPAIRDRDMGITEDVFIHASDPIEITNLYVTSDLPLPSTAFADLTISGELVNHSSTTLSGFLSGKVSRDGFEINIDQAYDIAPGDTIAFHWNRDYHSGLRIKQPSLWWPVGYGDPDLYQLELMAKGSDHKLNEQLDFGIREVETYIGANERVYKVNGEEIYCKGGNWVLDMMLNWTAERYVKEIALTKNANLNMLRVWGPTGVAPDVFYETADREGILIWQDFLNDFWGTFKNTPGMSPDLDLFEKATIEIVKRHRNHPSLIIWCGGNEGPNPREDLIMNKILPEHDGRDSKHYLKISNGDGLHGGGPYHTIAPEQYLTEKKLSGFSSEIGPSGVPVYESLIKFMDNPGGHPWKPGRFPLDGVWAYHDAVNFSGSDMRKYSHHDNLIRNFYGAPDSTFAGVEDYMNKCQLLNHDVYRACMEAINSQLWENSSGILFWKTNSSWPSMLWQAYDWYLQCHAGYYGIKKGAAPLTIQYNRRSGRIEALNASPRSLKNCIVSAKLYDSSYKEIWSMNKMTDLQKNAVNEFDKEVLLTVEPSYLKLEMKDSENRILAENFYWLSLENDFTSFNHLKDTELSAKVLSTELIDGEQHYAFELRNEGDEIALLTQLKIINPVSFLEILPSYWSDNFVSLLPGEKKSLQLRLSGDLPEELSLSIKAFNMKSAKLTELK